MFPGKRTSQVLIIQVFFILVEVSSRSIAGFDSDFDFLESESNVRPQHCSSQAWPLVAVQLFSWLSLAKPDSNWNPGNISAKQLGSIRWKHNLEESNYLTKDKPLLPPVFSS